MKRFVFSVAAIVGTLTFLLPSTAVAQAMVGRQLPDRPRLELDYYKVQPGKQDEWLALYLRWHRPIMQYEIDHGQAISSTVYANSSHAIKPSYDFLVVNYYPAPNRARRPDLTRGEIIKKLFPNIDAYVSGEKSRWGLIVSHWDEQVTEVDLKAQHPGVYYPILPSAK